MKITRTRLAAGLALLVPVALALSACGGSATTASSSDDTVVIGSGAVPQSLDPILASDVQTDFTDRAMYDKLVDYDSDGNLEAGIATDWEFAADAASVVLTLRDDVTFHSGNHMTAADVVYTLDRIKRLGTGVASFISDYVSSEAIDDTHVEITLSGANLRFVGALSKVYVLDSALVEQNLGDDDGQTWLASNDAGSGVYELDDYTANQQASFHVFEDSWDLVADRPATLVYRYISTSSTIRDELKSGGVDVATGLTAEDVATFDGQSGFSVVELPSYMQTYVMMNTQASALSDVRVREAIQLAYDYTGHVATAMGGNGTVATGIVAPNLACRADTGESEQDVEQAKELLAEAGVSGLTLTLAYQSQIPEHAQAATLLQSNLADIGITVELKSVTFPEYTAMVQSADTTPDLAILWDFPYYPEVGPMLYRVYDSAFIDQTNYSRYSNPDVDSLLEAGMSSTDSDTACSDFEQAQQLIADDHVSVDIANQVTQTVTDSAVSGIQFRPTSQLFDVTDLRVAAE
ncbi:MAG: ABC transporter substrate-binding protein [Microbacterium sp.]|uniref:ABC transporter substrate-binding protein n=1 Tax=Microbacterium sp. TaxID=51671 RepID=UPI0039E2A85F